MRPSGSKRYPRSWSGKGGIREWHLRRHPACEVCGTNEHLQVDHIDGNRENHAPSNLCTLCRSCHGRKTVRENGGFGRKRRRVLR